MRVVTVTTLFPNSGDQQRAVFVENLVRAMQRQCLVTVIAPLPYAPPLPFMQRWRAMSKVSCCENIRGIEVKHPRFLLVPKLNWFTGLFYCLGVLPILFRLRRENDPFLLHAHFAYPDGVGVALAARLLRLKYVLTVHGSDINVHAMQSSWLRMQIRWAMSRSCGVIAVSRPLQSKVLELMDGIEIRSECIPCAGFDPQVFFPRRTVDCRAGLELSEKARVVLFVGHLIPVKGIDYLLEAWAQLMRVGKLSTADRLVIVGDGAERNNLQRQTRMAGLSHLVQFAGVLPQATVSQWLSAADLLCLPSHSEGTPNVVVEALASGVPAIATRVGGVPDLINDGVNGFLVEPGDIVALASAIDSAFRKIWDISEIQKSVEQLTWEELARRNCCFFRSVTS